MPEVFSKEGPTFYLAEQSSTELQELKASGGLKNTPPGIQADGINIQRRLNPKDGTPATVKGIKMEVAIPRAGESGTPSLTIKEWH